MIFKTNLIYIMLITFMIGFSNQFFMCNENYYTEGADKTDECYDFYYNVMYNGVEGTDIIYTLMHKDQDGYNTGVVYNTKADKPEEKSIPKEIYTDTVFWYETFTKQMDPDSQNYLEGYNNLSVIMRLLLLNTIYGVRSSNKAGHGLLETQLEGDKFANLLSTQDYVLPLSTLLHKSNTVNYVFDNKDQSLNLARLFEFGENYPFITPSDEKSYGYSVVNVGEKKAAILSNKTGVTTPTYSIKVEGADEPNMSNYYDNYAFLNLVPEDEKDKKSAYKKVYKQGSITAPFGGYGNYFSMQDGNYNQVYDFSGENKTASMVFTSDIKLLEDPQMKEIISVHFDNSPLSNKDTAPGKKTVYQSSSISGTSLWNDLKSFPDSNGLAPLFANSGQTTHVKATTDELYQIFYAADYLVFALQNFNDYDLKYIKAEFWRFLIAEKPLYRLHKLYNLLSLVNTEQDLTGVTSLADQSNLTDIAITNPFAWSDLNINQTVPTHDQIILNSVCEFSQGNEIYKLCASLIRRLYYTQFFIVKQIFDKKLTLKAPEKAYKPTDVCFNQNTGINMDFPNLLVFAVSFDGISLNANDVYNKLKDNKEFKSIYSSINSTLYNIKGTLEKSDKALFLPQYFEELVKMVQVQALKRFQELFKIQTNVYSQTIGIELKNKKITFPTFEKPTKTGFMNFNINFMNSTPVNYFYNSDVRKSFIKQFNECYPNIPKSDDNIVTQLVSNLTHSSLNNSSNGSNINNKSPVNERPSSRKSNVKNEDTFYTPKRSNNSNHSVNSDYSFEGSGSNKYLLI